MKDKLTRVDIDFDNELEDMKIQRVKTGIDKEMKSDRRLTKAIRRHPLFPKIKNDIIISELKDDRKGFIMDIIIWIILGFVLILVLGGWYYGHNLMTGYLTTLGTTSNNINLSQAAADTFGQTNTAMAGHFGWMTFVIIITMALSILITNFLIKAHPVFFVVYVMIIIVGVIFSVYVSNAYETLMTNAQIGSVISSYSGSSFIMLHLPVFTTIIGLMGAIFLFAGIIRTREQGGGI